MLVFLEDCDHLPDARLDEAYCFEELNDLLPRIAELAAKSEDHAGNILDVGGTGDRSRSFAAVHGRGLVSLKNSMLRGEQVILVDDDARSEACELTGTETLFDSDVGLRYLSTEAICQ